MKRLAASVSAIAVALGAVLLAPLSAQADEATVTISDPTGDVERDPGVSKKDTSDVMKWGIAYDKHTVTVTWWFKNLRKGTVKHFAARLYPAEYPTEVYVLVKVPGVGAGLYAGDAVLCEVEIDQKKGENGRYRVSFDRSCLVPEGETSKVKTLSISGARVGDFDADAGWGDVLDPELVLGPAIP